MAQMMLGRNVAPKSGRRMRRPVHQFHVRSRPFQIQPFCIAPVLAGETMKNLLLQSRVVVDPIKNPLIGWWQEYYFFYCKLTDIDFFNDQTTDVPGGGVGNYVKMLLADPSFDPTATDNATPVVAQYDAAGSQTYIASMLDLITAHYFRDEKDVNQPHLLDGLPLAMINNSGILNSAMLDADYLMATADVDVDIDLDSDGTTTASEVDEAMRRYEWARQHGITDATYDDYLASFGINTAAPDPHAPELVRYVRQWQYPSNTVEPTTGVPSSAVSWSIQERADKDRFFKEPGFIFGVTVTRPKVYLGNQLGNVAGHMDRAEDWLPAALWSDQLASMKKMPATGPFDLGDYWVDLKDLFVRGDQFINFLDLPGDTNIYDLAANMVALPDESFNHKFVSDEDVDGLFVAPSTKGFVRQDGIVQLTIASHIRDTSPTV